MIVSAANAHHILNRSDRPCRYLIAGTRVGPDVCHYPDPGRRLVTTDSDWWIEGYDGSILRRGKL
jgi:uncharacterized cupin superfamily protein